jgi:flagellar hook assembly protein FlgD
VRTFTLRVYDAAGRLVRNLLDDTRAASEHAVAWDGRDDTGASMAAGVYLYKLETNHGVQTRRMVLVK